MAEQGIPDRELVDRLEASAAGITWAARLVQPYQHTAEHDDWTAHRDAWHLVDVERHYLRPRLHALLETDNPDLRTFPRAERPEYTPARDIVELAFEFVQERALTLDVLRALRPEQWFKTARWSEERVVDVAWLGERILWHGMDHFAVLLRMHNQFEGEQSVRWRHEA